MVVAVASIALLGLLNPASTKPMVWEPDTSSDIVQESSADGTLPEVDEAEVFPVDAASETLAGNELSRSIPNEGDLAPQETLPGWFFAAIALSCATGCFILWRWLNRSGAKASPRQKTVPPKTVPPIAKGHAVARRRLRSRPRKSPRPATQRKMAPAASLARTSTSQLGKRRPAFSQVTAQKTVMKKTAAKVAKNNRTEPVVTVVPPGENHPLDWGEASLAEVMDLRKQQPLSSIL